MTQENNNKFQKEYMIRYSETGANGRITCPNILNYFQDIGSDHAGILGISAFDLIQQNMAWVIYKMQLRIKHYPKWDTPFTLSTWRYPYRKLYEIRAFEGKNNDNQVLFSGKCSWVMINLSNKKPVRLDRHLPKSLLNNYVEINHNFLPIAPLDRNDWSTHMAVRMHHLDFNQHVNNTIYLQWAIESVPLDIQTRMLPCDVDIQFIGDAHLGDSLTCYSQQIDSQPTFRHQIMHMEKELTWIQTLWKEYDYGPLTNT
ncbi:MAG: Acyl-acyl carrier protein thioesterase [Candidatus Magnetoglobus multicellularis str. Araruama]|uniref:Acyl-acyl carrier protein thioesterase n=1 Tax=Candidatus Magnetoglobus multicellularis str. Araruama TaxID=890399 RepID=A0A1V1PD18_9BACT|nr:MAG: Acyl-acyl carrier protein thioesterase [Candidatus Magnetoglobus multicellularis str. Araruama]